MKTKNGTDTFHAHLDVCAQCEKHPFDLCPIGAVLLQGVAIGPSADPHEQSAKAWEDWTKEDIKKEVAPLPKSDEEDES